MKQVILAMALAIAVTGCHAQQKQEEQQVKIETPGPAPTNEPKAAWKVNKQYDEKGNLIRYDSTYTWSYSSKGGHIDADSFFSRQWHNGFFSNGFGPQWSDSSFFYPGFFMRRWQSQNMQMQKMLQQMDSLNKAFFKENDWGTGAKVNKI